MIFGGNDKIIFEWFSSDSGLNFAFLIISNVWLICAPNVY